MRLEFINTLNIIYLQCGGYALYLSIYAELLFAMYSSSNLKYSLLFPEGIYQIQSTIFITQITLLEFACHTYILSTHKDAQAKVA